MRTLAAVQGFMSVGSILDLKFIFAVRCENNILKDVMDICCEKRWIEVAMVVTSSGLCVEPWVLLPYCCFSKLYCTQSMQNCIVPSPCKMMAVSNDFGNPACCMCEFSGLKGKVKL